MSRGGAAAVSVEQRAAAILLLRERAGRQAKSRPKIPLSFGAWLAKARPEYRWDAPHFCAMQGLLDAVTCGDKTRGYFQIPIRHGKTEHNTVSYAAYRLELDPRTRILVCSYNSQRAQKFSREIRRLCLARGIVAMSTERAGAGEWETTAGGGVQAVGAGMGVASVNADLILIDDPIGSRDDAESQAKRDQVWDWLTNDILARCEPHTAVLFTMSRWHQDDPAGRLMDQQAHRWTVIDLPAEAEDGDALGRPTGAPLWPALRGAAWLTEKREELGAYGFSSLLQGRPRPRSGGMFKWTDWQLLDAMPENVNVVRFWDTAGTDKKGAGDDPDFTVGAAMARLQDLRTVVMDMARFRHAVTQRDAAIAAVARADAARWPHRIRWRFEAEAGIGGADRTAHLLRIAQAAGIPCDAQPATGNKVVRAEPLASAVGAHNILLALGEWRDALRTEAADFPTGKHDDQVDACTGAFNMLSVPAAAIGFSHFGI